MLTVRKRKGSPYYQISGTYLGVRVRQTTGTTSFQEAKKLRAKLERDLEQSNHGEKTFADAIEAYIDNGGEDKYLARINEVLGDVPLAEVRQQAIDEAARKAYGSYKKTAKGKTYTHKPSTIKRQFYDPVAAVLHYAHDLEWIPYIRVNKPQVTLPPPEWAEPEYFEKLFKHCDKEVKALTMFLCLTGCRISECLDLEWKNVDLKNKKAFIPKTKTKAYRTVHLPAELVKALKSLKPNSRKRPETELLAIAGRQDLTVFSLDYWGLRWRLKKASKAAKIPYMSTHKIGSHTFATWMRRYMKLDARGLKDTGRWASIQMAERYTHTDVSESSRKSEGLGALLK